MTTSLNKRAPKRAKKFSLALAAAAPALAALSQIPATAHAFCSPFGGCNTTTPAPTPVPTPAAFKFADIPAVKSPLDPLTIQAQVWDPNRKLFGPEAFYQDIMTLGPDGYRAPNNPIGFATRETADQISRTLGCGVSETVITGFYVRNHPEYGIYCGSGAQLSAGLIANTFNQNPPHVALLMLRTEIARETGVPIPSAQETNDALACGKPVLGLTVLPNPLLASTPCRLNQPPAPVVQLNPVASDPSLLARCKAMGGLRTNGNAATCVATTAESEGKLRGFAISCVATQILLPFTDPSSGLNYYYDSSCSIGTNTGFGPELLLGNNGWSILRAELSH